MQIIYESDSFAVVQFQVNESSTGEAIPLLPRYGFEIVDKYTKKEVYLDGAWAEFFESKIRAWREDTPTQEEVEITLSGYAELAQNPLMTH